MRFNKLFATLAVAAIPLCLLAVTLNTAAGRGTAVDRQEDYRTDFTFSVREFGNTISGKLEVFYTSLSGDKPSFSFNMGRVTGMKADGNEAYFSGPGVVTMEDGSLRLATATVHVVDEVREPGDKFDRFELSFTPNRLGLPEFKGDVIDGNIEVVVNR